MIELACKELAFHFNKKHLEDASIPMWTLKTGGKSYYVDHIDANIPFSTKETPDNSHTKGSIKFKNALLCIEKEGFGVSERSVARIDRLTDEDKERLSGKKMARCVTGYRAAVCDVCDANSIPLPDLKYVTGSCGGGFWLFELEPKDATVLALTIPNYKFRTLAETDPLYKMFENPSSIDADAYDIEDSDND